MIDSTKLKNTSLCYIERDGEYLMMHRVKKQNDANYGKWIGIGGKFEADETAFDCAMREVVEETGAIPNDLVYRGVITFISDVYDTEVMHLFTASGLNGEVNYDCDEGILKWVKKRDVLGLNLWEGDRIFLEYLTQDKPFFILTLIYKGDTLIEYKVD